MDIISASSVEIQRKTIFRWVTEYTLTPDNALEIQEENKFQRRANPSAVVYREEVPRCYNDLCEEYCGNKYTAINEQNNDSIKL